MRRRRHRRRAPHRPRRPRRTGRQRTPTWPQPQPANGEPGLVARGPTPLDDLAARYPDAPLLLDDPALAATLRPRFADRLRLVPTVFDDPAAAAIDALASTDIALPGGLRASIHPTPALVAIDMDMAAATGARQPKAAAQLAANAAALPALARQIRLRNLSGAILLDPAGISIKRRPLLAPPLRAALAADPLAPRLLGFTALGLAEILRPRVRPPLHETLAGPHAAGLAALRAIAREAAATPHQTFALACAPDVAGALGQIRPPGPPRLLARVGLRQAPALRAVAPLHDSILQPADGHRAVLHPLISDPFSSYGRRLPALTRSDQSSPRRRMRCSRSTAVRTSVTATSNAAAASSRRPARMSSSARVAATR